jgi:hypothetical protein
MRGIVTRVSDSNKALASARFSQELLDRVDAIAISLSLSQSSVIRMAIKQWFDAGGDKSGLFVSDKKIAKKAAPKGRGKRGK